MLVNTAAVADNIRDIEKALKHPRPHRRGYRLVRHAVVRPVADEGFKDGLISYESALFYSTNPSEFALRVSGVDSASDRKFTEITGDQSASRAMDLTP